MRASRRHTATVAIALLALLVASAAQADFKQSYARGKEAAAAGRWSEVEARMREAIAEQPQAQARVRIYGMRFEPYVPQYYLGLAAYRQGNCAEATRNWTDAAAAGIVRGDSTLQGVVDEGLGDCKRKSQTVLAQQQPAPAPTTPPPSTTPAPTITQAPSTRAPATTAPAQVATTTPPPAPATRPAIPPVAQQSPAVGPTPTRPTPVPAPAPAPAAAQSAAPAALVAAVDTYIAGRFEQSANIDLAPFSDRRVRFHGLLLRSAARHQLAEAGGERGTALLAAAQADIREAKSLAPGQAPDAALFSPRYRKLYESVR